MPAKKNQITDAQRAHNMRALAREVGASDDAAALDRALRKIVRPKDGQKGAARKEQ